MRALTNKCVQIIGDKHGDGGGTPPVSDNRYMQTFGAGTMLNQTPSAKYCWFIKSLCTHDIESANTMMCFIATAGTAQATMGIYNSAGSLLSNTAIFPDGVTGFLKVALLTPLNLVAGETYWLALKDENGWVFYGMRQCLTHTDLSLSQFYTPVGLPSTINATPNNFAPWLAIGKE